METPRLPLQLLLVLALAAAAASAAKLPPSFKTCKQTDSDYKGCLKKAIQGTVPALTEGVTSLGMQPLDPLRFTQIAITQTEARPVSLNLELNDVVVTGISNGIIDSIEMTPGSYHLKAKVHTDKPLYVKGNYKADGKVLVLPVQGAGQCNITFPKMAADLELLGEVAERGGEKYWEVKDFKVDLHLDTLSIYLSGLYNGDKALGDNTNKFLNENGAEVLKELKPAIDEAMGASFKDMASRLFSKVPYNDVFPPS